MASELRTYTKEEIQEACRNGDLSKQWEWHEAFRDSVKNMYRTTTMDTQACREVAVHADLPSGFGGHVRSRGHDILFHNTGEYTTLQREAVDPNRDTYPCFKQQKYGSATFTKYTANEGTPEYGSLPDVVCQPPWGIMLPIREVPSHKTVPYMDVRKNQ